MNVLRDTWPETGLLGNIGREFNKIARMLNGLTGSNGIQIYRNYHTLEIAGSAGLDLSLFAFGLLGFDGQDAIVKSGPFKAFGQYYRIGSHDNENKIRVGGNKDNKHLIVVEIRRNGTSGFLPSTVAESSFTGDTAGIIREPLYRVYLDDGEPVLDEIISIGMRRL